MNSLRAALDEVMMTAELQPGLTQLTVEAGADRAGYFRFPRAAVGELGAAMLQSQNLRLAMKRPFMRGLVEMIEVSQRALIVMPVCQVPFAERGSAAVVLERRGAAFGKREVELVESYRADFTAAHRRIVRFEEVIGQYGGLTSLIEQRIGACVAFATGSGALLWMSKSASDLLGEEGRARLEVRLAEAVRGVTNDAKNASSEITLMPQGKARIFGELSFIRENPNTSVHYIAIELFGDDSDALAEQYRLTRSEREVYKLMRQGLSNQDIAAARFISVDTVRSHVKKVNTKLGVSSRLELVAQKLTKRD